MLERNRFEQELSDLGIRAQALTLGSHEKPRWIARARELESEREATADDLIGRGESENLITNEVFYTRNPKLRGRAVQGKQQQAQWLAIRDREVRPAVKAKLQSWVVDPALLAAFFSQYEGDSRVPAKATHQFLTQGPLLSAGRSLRDSLISRWRSGKAPVKLAEVYQLALQLSGHPGCAMLLCHNVTKAFARGGTAITWDRDPSAPQSYSDGKKLWEPKVIHKAGRLTKSFVSKYKRELPSIYYLLFSDQELGTNDPGDWYHYFVAASWTAFDGRGELVPASPGGRAPVRQRERSGAISDADYAAVLDEQLASLESQMTQGNMIGLPGYRGWVFANAVSFLEGGHYGDKQADVDRESRIHIQGAIAGLRAAKVRPVNDWWWRVPKAKSLSKVDLALGFSLGGKTHQTLPAADFLGGK